MTRRSEMDTHWFCCIGLARLSGRAKMFTESCFGTSLSTSNVLGPCQPTTHTTLLTAGQRVDDPRCSAGDIASDVESLTGEVALVSGGVGGVRTH